jgi:hypothetical protein
MAGENIAEQAIDPIYITEHINSSINIFNGNLELKVPVTISSNGSIEFRWQPSMSMRFKTDPIIFSPTFFNVQPNNYAILNIPTTPPMSYDVIITQNSFSANAGSSSKIQFAGEAETNRWRDILCNEMKFHIANMSNYIGSVITYHSDRSIYARRIAVSDDDWEITIDGVENIDKLIEDLRQDGGFAITHVGTLRHRNGLPFKVTEGLKQLKALGFFLSFVEGSWRCPVLLVGTYNGEIVFRDLSGNTRIDPWKGRWRWSTKEARYLNDVYKGFISKWQDPNWRGPIAEIIELYVRANTYPTVELSVLDSFTALDCLASAYSLDNVKNGYERIRQALSKGGLDNRNPPKDLYDIYDRFYKNNCPTWKRADSATILADFRHGVVHGDKNVELGKLAKWNRPKLFDDRDPNNPPVPPEIKTEAENLGLWCVEVSLLKLFGYIGHYNDRISRAQHVPMPT